MLDLREFLDEVEKNLAPVQGERGRGRDLEMHLQTLEKHATQHYDIFLTEEALQFINRSSTTAVKHWIVSIVGMCQLKSKNPGSLGGTMSLFSVVLKKAIQDLPASLALAQEVIIFSTRILSSSLQSILLQPSVQQDTLWNLLTQLNQQIAKLSESPSSTLRNHALKYIERLIFCYSFSETQVQPNAQTTTDITEAFSLNTIQSIPLPQNLTIKDLIELGRGLLFQFIEKLQKLAAFTKTDPINSCIPNQIVIINSLTIIHANRPKQFGKFIIQGLCKVTELAALSWTNSSQSRSLSYSLRHSLISIMYTNKWEQCGGELVVGLTKLDAKEKAESLYKQLRPLEFRELKRVNPNSADLPPPKRQRIEPPAPPAPSSRELLAGAICIQELLSLAPPGTFPLPFHKTLDSNYTQQLLSELEILGRVFSQLTPPITSTANTNRARDPRAAARDPRARNQDQVNPDLPNEQQQQIPTQQTPQIYPNQQQPQQAQVTPAQIPTTQIQPKVDQKPIPVKSTEPPTIIKFDKDETLKMRNKSIERILYQENGAKSAGKDPLRRRLVTRLVCFQKDLQHPLVQSVIKFLMDQFPSRIDLAIQWLYEEYYQCLREGIENSMKTEEDSKEINSESIDCWEKSRENVIKEESRYYQLLRMIVERLCIALQPSKESDPLFRSFILQVPDLSFHTIQTLQQFCASDEVDRVSLGLSSFREIILFRPAARESTLSLFLQYTVFPKNDSTRSNAIDITIDSLYEKKELKTQINDFALDILQSLSQAKEVEQEESTILPVGISSFVDKDNDVTMKENHNHDLSSSTHMDDDDDDEPGDVTVIGDETKHVITFSLPTTKLQSKHVEQKAQLFMKLCAVDHSLVKQLAAVYIQCIREVQRILQQESKFVFKSMKQTDKILFDLLADYPPGAESLLLHMLRNIIQDATIDPELCQLLQNLFKKEKLDARFLIHTLRVSDKEKVLGYLPALISISSPKLVASAMYSILSTPPSETSLSPTELLVHLHILDKTKHSFELKKQFGAIQICLKAPIFNQKSLAVVLQQLVEIDPVPKIFLRTMIDIYKMHPKLEDFILELLSKLVTKQVWKLPDSWEGFIKCCELAKPNSFPIMIQLPPSAFKDALKACDKDFRKELLQFCETEKIPKALTAVINALKEAEDQN